MGGGRERAEDTVELRDLVHLAEGLIEFEFAHLQSKAKRP
jgi:hypothetical protein